MINDQNSWWCRYCFLFPGRCLTSRRLLSMLMMVVTIQIGCFSAAMDSFAIAPKTLPLMDIDFSGCYRSNHVIDGRCSVLVTKNLFLQGAAADQTAPPRFDPDVSPLPDQCASPLQPESVLSRYRSLILGSLAVFFFLLSMGLLLFLLLTKGRSTQRLLLKQRQLLEDITGNLPAVVYQFYVNADGTYGLNYVNQKAADILELDLPLASFFTAFTECIHPDDKARFFESIENAGKNKTPWHFEGRFVKPSGSQMWFSGDATPHQNRGQTQFNGVIMDVTKRKWMEEKLRTSEQRMSQIINFLPDPTFVIDSDSKVIAWNRAMEELTKVSAETILGKGNYEYALPFYGQRRPITIDLVRGWSSEVAEKYINIERKGNILISETKDHYPLLNKGLFRNVAGPLYDEAGNLIGAIESIHDITSRRKVLNDLREREELLGFFVTYTPVPVAMLDLQMNYLHYSRRWVTDFNLPDEDLTGRCHYDVMGPIPEHWKEEHHRCLQGESIQKEEETFTRADGSVEWVRRTLYPWRTHEDKIGGIIILVELTTAKKRAEQTAHEMEQRLKTISINLPVGLIFQSHIKPDGSRPFTFISGNVEHFFGVTDRQVMANADLIFDQIMPEDRKRLFAAESKAIDTLSVMDQMIRVRRKSGRIRWQRIVAKPRRLSNGDALLDGIAIDMTTLKEAEANLRLMERVVENSPMVLFRWEASAGWPVVYVSENVNQFGYSPAELTSGQIAFESLIHPEDRMHVAQEVDRYTIAGNTHFQQEYRIVTKSGEIRWVDDRSVIERDNEGRVSHYQGVVLDVSDRKKAQDEIHKRQLFLEAVLYQAPDAIIVMDADHRVTDWNPGAEKIFGHKRSEILGKILSEIVADNKSQAEVINNIRTVNSGQHLETFDAVRYRKDGTPIHVIVAGSPIVLDGEMVGAVAMYTDITALKKAEADAIRNERMLRRIMDMVPSMIFVKNAQGRFLMANQAVADCYGMPVDALVGKLQRDVHPDPQQVARYMADDRQTIQSGQALLKNEEPFTDHTGAVHWLEVSKLPCDLNDFGEPALVVLATDVTERRETDARIQESERRYRMIFENTGTGTVLSEADMTLTMVNREFAQMVGYARKEIEGKMKWTDFIAPDDVEQIKAYHYARREDPFNTPNQYECKLIDRAGRLKPMLLKARLIPGTQTSIGAFLDISDRKQTEEALVVANRMLRLVLDTIPVYVFWKDTACRYLGCNQPFAENAGFSDPEALIGLDDYELVWYKQAPAYRRDDRAVMTTGQARLNFEEKQTTANGKTVWVQTSKVPMRDGQENIIGLLGTLQDITESKRAREELQRLRNYLSNIIDSMPSVLIGVDNQMRVTQWNKQAEKQTGLPFEKAHKQPLESAYPRLADELDRIKAAIEDRKVHRNLKIPRPYQGGTQFEDITIFPLEADGTEGAVIRLDNVTEQVRMEEMMIQSEKMLSVGGLAAGMAHEINNPLAGILQNTAVLENRLFGELPANHKAAEKVGIDLAALRQYLDMRSLPTMLENIRSSGNRAAAIVKNMLSFARKSDLVVSSHDLGALLDQTIELAQTDYDMKKHYDFKQIQIIREYDQTAPPVPCESSKIQQVFLNILKNGAEAMADNAGEKTSPMFVLRVKDDDAWVRVEIEDNGPGMDEPTRRRIFEPFFTTKPVGKGTGLGLSVSYFIITENHGGKMDAHVVDDGGTRFIIQLPKTGMA